MGFVESMQQLESSLASLNGSQSEARLMRKPVERGECSYRPNLSKILKRRRVSAVRTFPPGCGRSVHLNNALGGNAATSSVPVEGTNGLNDIAGTSRSVQIGLVDDSGLMNVEPFDADTVIKDVVSDLREIPNQLAGNLTFVQVTSPVDTADQPQRLYSGDKNGDDDTAVEHELSKDPHQVPVTTLDEETIPISVSSQMNAARRYPPRRKVSAVRNFPPLCGRNANLGGMSFFKKQSHMGEKPSSSIMPKTSGQQMGEDDIQEAEIYQNGLGGNVSAATENKVHAACKRLVVEELERQNQCKLKMKGVSEHTGKYCLQLSSESKECQGRWEDVGYSEKNLGKETVVCHEKNSSGVNSERSRRIVKDVDNGKRDGGMQERKNRTEPFQEKNTSQGRREVVAHLKNKVGKEIVKYHEKNNQGKNYQNRVVVIGLMAASNCTPMKAKGAVYWKPKGDLSERRQKKPEGGLSGTKRKKQEAMSEHKWEKSGCGPSESKQKTPDSKCQPVGSDTTTTRTKNESTIGRKPRKTDHAGARKHANQGTSQQLVIRDEIEDFPVNDAIPISCNTDVCPPPFGQVISNSELCNNGVVVTRNKVRETLRLFQAVSRKLLQEEEANSKEGGRRRVDLQAAKILKDKGKYVNVCKILGPVPGVEVGDEFHYRVELNMIGLHRHIQGGIDYLKHGGKTLATSIVASGGYADDLDNSNSLIYTGQGGNVQNTEKEPEDQKLERGNLALKNSMHAKNPVRVIRGSETSDGKSRTYVYDGLYLVEKCWQEMGPHDKLVYKFQLDRIEGQPELAWKELKKSKKAQVRAGICVDDVSGGKESIPISAVNTIDDEKPPPFEYITSMIYPDWCRPLPLKGCSCTAECSDSDTCSCAVMNGGEIPYNFNMSIVEAKPLVYECGPSCKCPPSCHNRVSQHGIQFQLEIFKTKSMGWGVRSLNSIPSGSFICEYVGELLEETEAEARTGNDEYLFDIGNNFTDNSLWDGLSSLIPDAQSSPYDVVEEGCFTIDAAQKGNLGRFINHSCSPNLYAQNVLYDHEDNRIPHIMFFAAENIPPLQELTYHYNYMLDQVRDSNDNIKKKSCFCGSPECTGRLY